MNNSQISALLIWLCVPVLFSGCATAPLGAARANFYRGNFEQADLALAHIPDDDNDKMLVLMERGTIRQARHLYAPSTKDWLDAVALGVRLDYYSVSQGAASLAINDRVMAYRGAPYEHTLMRAFAAKSYFAMSMWDDAAVEARNIILRLENLYGFPDDPYSRYLAGFCLEMTGDSEGASFQYRTVAKMKKELNIGESDGHIAAAGSNAPVSIRRETKASGRPPNWCASYPWEEFQRSSIMEHASPLRTDLMRRSTMIMFIWDGPFSLPTQAN